MKKIRNVNIYFIIIMALEIIMPSIIIKVLVWQNMRDIKILLFVNHFICFIIPAIIYIIVTKSNIKQTFRLNKVPLKDLGIVILIAFACQPVMTACSAITAMFFQNNVSELFSQIKSAPYIVLLLLIAVMPAISEEITLRGIVLSGYNGTSKFKAALITGVLFGIFHFDAQQFLYATVLGFILAYIVRVTNSIFSSMIIHFLVNGTSVTLQYIIGKINSNVVNYSEEVNLTQLPIDQKITIMIIYILIGAVFAVAVFLLIRLLEKWNNQRNNINGYEVKEMALESERVINIPFIIIIITYIVFMTLNLLKIIR